MKNFIIKSNEWYDNLPEPKRTYFFLIVVLFVLIAQISLINNFLWIWMAFIVTIVFWRISYTIINLIKDIKNEKE